MIESSVGPGLNVHNSPNYDAIFNKIKSYWIYNIKLLL